MVRKQQAIVYALAGAGALGVAVLAAGAARGAPGDVVTDLTISTSPNPSDLSTPVTISGRLTREDTNGGVPNASVVLETARSQTALLWATLIVLPTNPDGSYAATWTPPSGITYVRARFAGAAS